MEPNMVPVVYTDPRITYYRAAKNNRAFDEPEYAEFRILDAETVRANVVDCLGAVLACCWLDTELMQLLRSDPHCCLLRQGIVLPKTLDIQVEMNRGTNRPSIIVYEIVDGAPERICSLRLSMMAEL